MPIKKTSILAWATALKIPKADIDAAEASADEVEVAVPTGLTVFTDPELLQRDTSLKAGNTTASREILIKELKEKTGLEYDGQGSKDPERFIAEFQKKAVADAGIQESDKVKGLNETVKQLQTNLQTIQGTIAAKDAEVTSAKLDAQILTETVHLKPDNLENDEWVDLIKKRCQITTENDVIVVKRDGKVVADPTTLVPVPVKDALVGFITERKIGKVAEDPNKQTQPKGRGPNDTTFVPGSITTMTQFKDHIKSAGLHAAGQEAQSLLREITAANPNFDVNGA